MAQPRSSITNPDWTEKPTGQDLAASYPVLATALGVEGYAVISCRVNVLGKLVDCKSTTDEPKALGFGAAALAMSDHFKMRPMALNGVPVDGGSVRIPIRFNLPTQKQGAEPPKPASDDARKEALRLVDAYALVDENTRSNSRYDRTFDEEDEGVTLASHNLGVDIVRKSWSAHREDLRNAYAAGLASVFSADEMRQQADFATGPGLAFRGPAAFPTGMFQVLGEFVKLQRAAAHQAFCAKQTCPDASEIAAAWRAAPARDDRLDTPQWLRAPNENAVRRAAPTLASAIDLMGAVRLTCRLDDEGALKSCAVDEEAPTGMGYGPAALKLTDLYRLSPVQLAAGAAGRKVTLRVGFSPLKFDAPYKPPTGQTENALALARTLVTNPDLKLQAQRDIEVQVLAFQGKRPDGADARTYEAMIEAYRAGAQTAATQTAELQAQVWAAARSEEQLAAMIAFQASAGGKAQRERTGALEIAIQNTVGPVNDQITADARAEYCKVRDCVQHRPPQSAEESPAASTRKP